MITCYAQPEKPKSVRLIEAFAAGCGGHIASTGSSRLEPGAAVFYGVRAPWLHLWEQAKREGRDWYYIDNSYFDCARERQFRVTKNAIQHTGLGDSDGKRFAALGVSVKPMRADGSRVILAAQSQEFMEVVAADAGWFARVSASLRTLYGAENVIVRTKRERRPLLEDLKDAALLVTWSSAAAVTALLEGVCVGCAPQCCATYATDRAKWAAALADQQWSEAELRDGTAWRAINA